MTEQHSREAFFNHIVGLPRPRTDDLIARVIEFNPGAWRAWQAGIAAHEATQAPRFFVDHGTVHDRQTGQHLYTEAELLEARREAAQPVAPIEGWRLAPARMKFKDILRAYFGRAVDDEDSDAGRALMAFDDLTAWQKKQARAQAEPLSVPAVSHCINQMLGEPYRQAMHKLARLVEQQCALAWGVDLATAQAVQPAGAYCAKLAGACPDGCPARQAACSDTLHGDCWRVKPPPYSAPAPDLRPR